MMTKSTKIDDIKRNWHVIDAADTVLGRMSSKAAELLMGKSKPNFVRYLDCGDHVVIINAAKFIVTGRKNDQKKYSTYSGYPGGMKMTTFKSPHQTQPHYHTTFDF
jgi:large subunit ribosomal protein L13